MALRRHSRQHTLEIGETIDNQQNTLNNRKYKNSNYILLGSVAMYLITQTPSLIVNCLMIAADNHHSFNFPHSARLFFNPFVTTSYFISYSVNFLLYLAVSERFRAQFGQMFGRSLGLRSASSHSAGSVRSRLGNKPETDNIFNLALVYQSSSGNPRLHQSRTHDKRIKSPLLYQLS